MSSFLQKNSIKIAHLAIVIIYLALIRCIAEFFRLEFIYKENLMIAQVRPFMLGALVAAIACFIMNLLLFYNRHKIIPFIAILCIMALVIIKIYYKI